MTNYAEIVQNAVKDGGLLDAALACQATDGHVSDAAVEAIATQFERSAAEVYDSVTFYSMLRFEPKGKTIVEICRGAPCHVAGSDAVIAAIEKALGISVGEMTADGSYTFEWTECQGQCQADPSVLVNGKLYTGITPESVKELLKRGAAK